MEIIVYTLLTAIWWISSFTVLLPFVIFLILSKTVRDAWFSFIFTKVVGPMLDPKFIIRRKQLFELLEQHLTKRNKSTELKVLEIGIGSGANLEHYPENSRLTALDMNPSFIKYFDENRKKFPQVILDEVVINFAEDMKDVSSDTFDLVVCTHVLCSVKSINSVLKEVKRVLKPGGKFLFMEHVAFPKQQSGYFVQVFATSLWKTYFNGCYLNRNIADSIQKAGFSEVQCDVNYPSSLPLFVRPHIMGIARK